MAKSSTNEDFMATEKISYESINKPLSEFIKSINKQLSYQVLLPNEWSDALVSLSLKNISIDDGIDLALKQLELSYSLVISPQDKQINIYITNNILAQNNITNSQNVHPSENINVHSDEKEISVMNLEAVPPEEGVENITEKDLLLKSKNSNTNIDLDNLTAVPPEDGVPDITEREASNMNKNSDNIKNIKDLTAVPPEDGVVILTEQQMLDQKHEQPPTTK